MVEPHRAGWTVTEADEGVRLDVFLTARADGDLTRARVQRLIDEGRVRVDGQRPAKSGLRLKAGQVIALEIPPPQPPNLQPEPMDLEILHEDTDLAVVNKPPGLSVHPGAGHATGTLVHGLLAALGDLAGIGGRERPGIVHRLDKDTSGLLVVAKNDRAHRGLTRQFAARRIDRRYQALVVGAPPAMGTIDAPLGRDPHNRKRFAVTPQGGRRAVTHWTMLERLGPFSWLEVRLETGRTHQIRVHLAWKGWPLLGDAVYGRRRARSAPTTDAAREAVGHVRRQMLHAGRLGFRHPTTGESLLFEARPPADMRRVLEALREEFA